MRAEIPALVEFFSCHFHMATAAIRYSWNCYKKSYFNINKINMNNFKLLQGMHLIDVCTDGCNTISYDFVYNSTTFTLAACCLNSSIRAHHWTLSYAKTEVSKKMSKASRDDLQFSRNNFVSP